MSTLQYHRYGSSGPRCGQAAMEFMVFFGIIAVVVIAVTYNVQTTTTGMNREMADSVIKDAMESIQGSLDMVFMGGDGFSANITIPEKIGGSNYTINITSGFLVINVSGNIKGAKLMADNITGIIKKGDNTITNAGGGLIIQ
jgi:hypothetical protein